ncbi:hypothetical protein BU14_0965s0005 [Porphyra umbilicalis]|uniref:Uncharacterized protein n=1 Tax=Porphyra umbilicalis TaxID=2786 RepID=A0A1X6NMY8_PORUM|nr:hypothetical protein BU14_0965s0005 [Porphyra umbilicalis]|eukprot:OSX69991.1 hypothetical protein BU14_0965s0005 [Porphyra umbilicalis]
MDTRRCLGGIADRSGVFLFIARQHIRAGRAAQCLAADRQPASSGRRNACGAATCTAPSPIKAKQHAPNPTRSPRSAGAPRPPHSSPLNSTPRCPRHPRAEGTAAAPTDISDHATIAGASAVNVAIFGVGPAGRAATIPTVHAGAVHRRRDAAAAAITAAAIADAAHPATAGRAASGAKRAAIAATPVAAAAPVTAVRRWEAVAASRMRRRRRHVGTRREAVRRHGRVRVEPERHAVLTRRGDGCRRHGHRVKAAGRRHAATAATTTAAATATAAVRRVGRFAQPPAAVFADAAAVHAPPRGTRKCPIRVVKRGHQPPTAIPIAGGVVAKAAIVNHWRRRHHVRGGGIAEMRRGGAARARARARPRRRQRRVRAGARRRARRGESNEVCRERGRGRRHRSRRHRRRRSAAPHRRRRRPRRGRSRRGGGGGWLGSGCRRRRRVAARRRGLLGGRLQRRRRRRCVAGAPVWAGRTRAVHPTAVDARVGRARHCWCRRRCRRRTCRHRKGPKLQPQHLHPGGWRRRARHDAGGLNLGRGRHRRSGGRRGWRGSRRRRRRRRGRLGADHLRGRL